MVKGVTVGEAAVRQDGATLTFNDSVNNLDEVAGYVTFEIEGRNTTDTTQEDRKSGTITSGGRSATVTVVKPEAGTSSAFYYKTGNMDSSDTDHVNWWLNANLEKAYVDSDIRIEDYIQGGQELVTDSFNIDVEGIHPNSLYGAGALVEFANKYPRL
ncbi:collagen binding domain-containing protein [Streptococcus iniae]